MSTTSSVDLLPADPTVAATEIAPGVTSSTPLPPVVEIVPWTDPSFEIHGHDPRSAYVERYWLGLLGPSSRMVKHYGSRSYLRPYLPRS